MGDRPTSAASRRRVLLRSSFLATLALAAGCSDGSGGGSTAPPSTNNFAVLGTNVIDGETWQLNRAIEIEFNEQVDFSTVSLSTVRIVDELGSAALGTFTLVTPRTVRFQPNCPTDATGSTGGFAQGRTYRVEIPAESDPGGGITVQNTAGEPLQTGETVSLMAVESLDPAELFQDTASGPPRLLVRGLPGVGLNEEDASYVEFPGRSAPDDRSFLSFDTTTEQAGIPGLVPINLYSDATRQFAFVLRFNQSLQAGPTNLGPGRIRMEYLDAATSTWQLMPSEAELLSNCDENGATVWLRPLGIVPQGSQLRGVIDAGFADITGDSVPAAIDNLMRVTSDLAAPGTASPSDSTDGILVDFTVAAPTVGSLQDTETEPIWNRARWGADDGVLEADFAFPGSGGPGGDFDWVVQNNEILFVNTDADAIVGGPGGAPTAQQSIVGGVIQVRDFIVGQGANVIFVGSQPVTVIATGRVEINGRLSVDGGDASSVSSINTTFQPEPGASGRAGGGDGGTGSFRTNASTPRGGAGQGAFGVPAGGGQGGETGYAPTVACSYEDRRGAGGGGGNFGAPVRYEFDDDFALCQTLVGMDGERGFVGSFDGRGAISQSDPAQGGVLGPSPFLDPSAENDFFGAMLTADGRVVRGELSRVWAGAGGGGGGDAVRNSTFPLIPFSNTGDEKGCGGGGGAGGIEILAVGDVRIGQTGTISADGGTGNGGENTSFFNRVGGGSGGGSGGHIVISSAGSIVIEAEADSVSVGDFYQDDILATVHEKRPLSALGGQGGCGRSSRCGANEDGERPWDRDAIPTEAFEGNFALPPWNDSTWRTFCNGVATCATPYPEGETPGAGGDGSPGLIQLHVADPSTQLVFPNRPGVYGDPANPLDPTRSCSPPPVGWTRPGEAAGTMVPFFSARSEALTRWISLGLARTNPDGSPDDQIALLFGGTDPSTGEVLRDGSVAQELPPLIPYTRFSETGGLPSIDVATGVIDVDGAAIPTLYRTNPQLLARFAVSVRDAFVSDPEREYRVEFATYDAVNDTYSIRVAAEGPPIGALVGGMVAPELELVPFFFRLSSGGVEDAYPADTSLRITFDAARADAATGLPSTDPADQFSGGSLTRFTADPADLNLDVWDYVRVRYEFEIDLDNLSAPRPGIDWMRLLYTF